MKQRELPATLEALVNRHGLCIAKDSDLYRSHLVGWMLKAYEAALASPEVQALQWQPIETAPKDGRQILLTNGQAVAQGWWEHEEPYIYEKRDIGGVYIGQDESDGFDGWLDCEGGMQPDPTHWMPLPAPPADAAMEKQP